MELYRLDQVCKVNPPKEINEAINEVSFIPMEAVSTNGETDLSRTISVDKVKNYSVFKNRDVLFAKITPCMENGKGGIVDSLRNGYGAGSTEFIVLRPDESKVLPEWIQLFLSQTAFRMECRNHMTGSAGQKRVPPKYLAGCELPVPPLHKQRRIVARIEELFSELDNSVATLQKTKRLLGVYRQAVYSTAFDGIVNYSPLINDFEITSGLTKNSKRNEFTIKKPYLRVANVYYNQLDLSEIKEIGVTEEEIEKTTLQKEDLLFVEGNGSKSQIGRVALWDGSIPNCLHQNHIIRGRAIGKISPKFALYYLISGYGRKQIEKASSSTSGLYTLSANKVRMLMVPKCSEQKQSDVIKEIDSRLSICDSIENTVNTALQKAEAMRQSILKQAFEGRL